MDERVSWRALSSGLAAGLLLLLGACSAQAEKPEPRPASDADRGQYLVERVGICADCHTPHLPTGAPDPARNLQGAPLGFAPAQPVPGWVSQAPPIAGMPAGWSEEQLRAFLETGQKPGGAMAAPPMPAYRFSPEDARAVSAYLKSLPAPEPAR